MRICVLADMELKEFDPSQYLIDYSWEMFIPQLPVVEFLRALDRDKRFDVYFNLCDGSDEHNEKYDGLDVVRALEKLNLPFTGSDSRFYNPTREEMQAVADSIGVRFTHGVNVTYVGELVRWMGL